MKGVEDRHRLLIVSGKGGVGKSLLAAAVARCSAERGLPTVLVTLDTRDARHPLIDVPLTYRPQPTAHGFAVCRVDAFEAAAEYARRSLPFASFYESFFKGRGFRDFAAAAPGFEELMCLGKLYQLSVESEFRRVVFDAPATGHLKDLLAVPALTQRAVRVGPLNHNARRIEDLLLDPERTRVLVATLAEEMPVREALETIALCRDQLRMGCGPVLVNRRLARRFADTEQKALDACRGSLSAPLGGALLVAREEAAEHASQNESLAALAGLEQIMVPRIVQSRQDGDRLVAAAAPHVAAALAATGSTAAPPPTIVEVPETVPDAGPAAPWLDLAELVARQRIIVCCGSGGVGKTTSAAALGVLAARRGLNALVMTIDPARRLAQAMGLEGLSHDPQPVPLDAPGSLSAMMLDSKRAFDRLVEQHAPDPRVRAAIFANHYYQQLSSSLGGSRELVAMERVLEVAAEDRFDLLIVDTPPSQHALDFLDAPERIISLLDGSMTGFLLKPYGLAARAQFNLFRQSSAVALKFMERLTGVQMLADLSDFLLAFSSMFDGFKERSHRVQTLLRDATTSFLLVCAPEPASLAQVRQFAARLARDRMQVAGVLANRVHPFPGQDELRVDVPERETWDLDIPPRDLDILAAAGDRAFAELPLPERLADAWLEAVVLAAGDANALRTLGADVPLQRVPRLSHDLHSMADLHHFAELLATPVDEPVDAAPSAAPDSG